MLQSFSRAYLDAVDQAHLGMSDTVVGSLKSRRWGAPPSMKRHGHPFPVTGDALKGACFLTILGWCHHDDSHFLRALGTKQCPGVSKDCLVRHILVHRHDEFPSRREKRHDLNLGPNADSCLYKIAHRARAVHSQISGTGVPESLSMIITIARANLIRRSYSMPPWRGFSALVARLT
jgi:hypothetical protein